MNNPRYPSIATRAAAPTNLVSVESMLNDLGIRSSSSATPSRAAERAAAADHLSRRSPLTPPFSLRRAITSHSSTTRVPVAGMQAPAPVSLLRNGFRSPSLFGTGAAGSVFPGGESILDNISASLPPIGTPPAVHVLALPPCLAAETTTRTTPRKMTKKADRHDFVIHEDDTAELHANVTARSPSRRARGAAAGHDIVLYEDETAGPALDDREAPPVVVGGAGTADAADANGNQDGDGGLPAEVQWALAVLMAWLARGAPARREVLGEVSGNSCPEGADGDWEA
ncbi:hypothetical protein LTR53_014207 [Teratosphaeriaceae sp. CCFEE 6253]|nr:hypothetical protein LTR53_014207 [Teratosphaeriaceae sp. CCFEE 6253]